MWLYINFDMIIVGAVWPHAMKRSDASFNIGVALGKPHICLSLINYHILIKILLIIGALNVLRRGLYICMNGRVFEATRCRRDPTSGLFYNAQQVSAKAKPKSKSMRAAVPLPAPKSQDT